jgi:hypothetical protein
MKHFSIGTQTFSPSSLEGFQASFMEFFSSIIEYLFMAITRQHHISIVLPFHTHKFQNMFILEQTLEVIEIRSYKNANIAFPYNALQQIQKSRVEIAKKNQEPQKQHGPIAKQPLKL